MPVIDLARLPAAERNRPNSLGRAGWVARWVRRLPGGVLFSPTRVDDRVSVLRKADLTQLLTIVLQVRSQPPRLERRSFCHPNVSLPVVVERPRNAIRLFR